MKTESPIYKLLPILLLISPLLSGAELSTYRGFQFGMSLAAAVKHSGMDRSEVKTIHQRPANIQELTWNPARFSAASRDTDPVQQVLFSFYNGQLSRMDIEYDSQKTEGLSVQDMIEAVSLQYGSASRPAVQILFPSSFFSEGLMLVARWEDANASVNLVQSPYGQRFGLIAFSKRLDSLAQDAVASGVRLDEQEAPQRRKVEEQNMQEKLDKVRSENKLRFRP
jgi:hypothetical protein